MTRAGFGGIPTLGLLATGRDNNLNLLRAAAATGVLVSHAWPIALGEGTVQPLQRLTGFTLGSLCVFVFFVISGFLIAGSWSRRPEPVRFTLARALRLMPGLAVSLVLVAFVMGPLVTDLSPAAYAADPGLWSFLARNLTLALPQYTLPGVFETNPYPTVEGSIWTLVHEAACYVGVLGAGLAGLMAPRRLPLALAAFALVWAATLTVEDALPGKVADLHGLALPFALGVTAWALRDRLPLSAALAAAGLLGALAVSRLDPAGAGGALSLVAWCAALGYASLWAAYVPDGWVRGYNRLGDYSYGIYIYAFPLQGLAVWLWGPMNPWTNIALALPLTIVPSVLSWHLVERPALELAKSGWRRQRTA